jgi:hypothetical protein
LVERDEPSAASASGPCSARISSSRRAANAIASGHEIGSSRPATRMSGRVSRSGEVRQPCA